MKNQNIILTKRSIARHTKRLIKEMETINHNIKLSEAQQMFARILGCKDFHELNSILEKVENNEEDKSITLNTVKQILEFENNPEFDFLEKNQTHSLDNTFFTECVKLLDKYFTTMEISIDGNKKLAHTFCEIVFYKNEKLIKKYSISNSNINFCEDQIKTLRDNQRVFDDLQISYYKDDIIEYRGNKEIITYVFNNNNIIKMKDYKYLNEADFNLKELNFVMSNNELILNQTAFSIAKNYMDKSLPVSVTTESLKYDLAHKYKGVIYKIDRDNIYQNIKKIQKRNINFFTNINISLYYLEELALTGATVLNQLNYMPTNNYMEILISILTDDEPNTISNKTNVLNNIYIAQSINHENYIFTLNIKKLINFIEKKLIKRKRYENCILEYINQELSNNGLTNEINSKFIASFYN